MIVVVVVDDDTYYWVYLSSDRLFQVYYKVRQVLLQSATFLLKSAIGITKCDDYYKVGQNTLLDRLTLHHIILSLIKQEGGTGDTFGLM